MNTAEQTDHFINGVDTVEVANLATKISQDENFGKFKFRANNQWINGARSRSTIQGFFAGGKERSERKQALYVDADQPAFLGGENTVPNLNALTTYLGWYRIFE